jgi:hypothetical protein
MEVEQVEEEKVAVAVAVSYCRLFACLSLLKRLSTIKALVLVQALVICSSTSFNPAYTVCRIVSHSRRRHDFCLHYLPLRSAS